MRRKYVIGILAALCAVMLVLCAWFLIHGKGHRPEFYFSNTVPVYTIGGDTNMLLSNVSVTDIEDQDITWKAQVEEIKVSEDRQNAKVTYRVMDSDGNVTYATQTVPCVD